MIEDPTVLYIPLLVIGAFFMIFGAILGFAAANMTGSKKIKQKPGEKRVDRPGLIEIARIWREQSSGKMVVEVGEKVFRLSSDLDAHLKDRLVLMVLDLRNWLGVSVAEAPKTTVHARPMAVPPAQTFKVPAQEIKIAALPREQISGVTPPSMKMVDIVSHTVSGIPDKPQYTTQSTSIVGQIDAILQARLENSPLRNRGIHLVELPGGGMEVVVGLERFDSVSAVTDPDIRAEIQLSVVEWEKKHYRT